MAKLPDADVILNGLVLAFVERRDYESKDLTGYRATVVTSTGGAAIVNFDLSSRSSFPEVMDRVLWHVVSAPWDMAGGSGMSTRFVSLVTLFELEALAGILEEPELVKN